MIRYRILLLMLSLAYSIMFAHGQNTLPKVSVEIDPGSTAFIGNIGLPFDEPFNIRGAVTDGLKKVSMTYKVNNWKHWMGEADKNKQNAIPWPNPGVPKDSKWTLQVGALYPNTQYTFTFHFLTSPTLAADKKADLYKSLYNALDYFVKTPSMTSAERTLVNTEINTRLKQAIGPNIKLTDINEHPYVMEVMDGDLGVVTTKLMNLNDVLSKRANDIKLSNAFFGGAEYDQFIIDLGKLSADASGLTPAAATLWNGPAASAVQDYKALKMSTITKTWIDPSTHITELFDGTKKFDNDGKLAATGAEGYNDASALVMAGFLKTLRDKKIATAGGDYFAADQNVIRTLLVQVNNVIRYQAEIKATNTDRANLLAHFPDVLADKFIYTTFTVDDRSNPDVTAQDNAYIGLDFGFADTYAYSHQVFLYEGVNFYLVPINKNVSLSNIHGVWRQLAKRFSIHLGLTQNVMGTPNKLYSPLIGSVGSVMLGAGFRINRFIHLNYGEMFFYEKDVNPVIDHQHLTVRPTFSITFDLVSTKAIGAFLGKLGIK